MLVHSHERGFTLIELMIGILLAMGIIAAGYTVFEGSNRATSRQNLENRMQDNALMAMDLLARNMKRAGFLTDWTKYVNTANILGRTKAAESVTTGGASDELFMLSGDWLPVCQLRNSINPGASTMVVTDVSKIQKGDAIGIGLTYPSMVADVNVSGKVVTLGTSTDGAGIGKVNKRYEGVYQEDGSTLSSSLNPPKEATNIRVVKVMRYYIDSTDPKHPVLMQEVQVTPPATPKPEPIAEDIEDFQVAYGIDSNNNRIIETGEWIDVPTMSQIDKLRMIRITVVARSPQPDPTLIGKTQTIPALENHASWITTDGYRRFYLTRIIRLKNIDVKNPN